VRVLDDLQAGVSKSAQGATPVPLICSTAQQSASDRVGNELARPWLVDTKRVGDAPSAISRPSRGLDCALGE
jgi:hypothetical protein